MWLWLHSHVFFLATAILSISFPFSLLSLSLYCLISLYINIGPILFLLRSSTPFSSILISFSLSPSFLFFLQVSLLFLYLFSSSHFLLSLLCHDLILHLSLSLTLSLDFAALDVNPFFSSPPPPPPLILSGFSLVFRRDSRLSIIYLPSSFAPWRQRFHAWKVTWKNSSLKGRHVYLNGKRSSWQKSIRKCQRWEKNILHKYPCLNLNLLETSHLFNGILKFLISTQIFVFLVFLNTCLVKMLVYQFWIIFRVFNVDYFFIFNKQFFKYVGIRYESLRPWINRTTWLNYRLIYSCKITFLIYKVFFWKFEKLNKRQ